MASTTPLGRTFLISRGLSVVAMVSIVGITAHFVSQLVSSNIDPPREIVGTLTVVNSHNPSSPSQSQQEANVNTQTSLAALYTLLSLPLFYSSASTTLLILTVLDVLLLLAFTIISVLLGRPISHLNCRAIRSASAASSAESAWAFAMALASGKEGSAVVGLTGWAGSGRAECFQTKAVWGLGVALCILFATSAVVLPVMWYKGRRGVVAKGEA
ncbi:hypothetical protein MBLNU13_g01222t2 [Cladosporium sp. NU13]